MTEKGTYSDPRCYACKPDVTATVNPPGWREVDGVQLPPITWGEAVSIASVETKKAVAELLLQCRDIGLYDEVDYRRDLVLRNGRAE